MLTRGDKNNRVYVGETVRIYNNVSNEMQSALFDPQTAGGLLISLSEESVAGFLAEIENTHVIGRVIARSDHLIEVR
jgi:selenide,water dikinase